MDLHNYAGVMDVKTREMMTMPRCGVSDLQVTNPRRRKRYVLYGKLCVNILHHCLESLGFKSASKK